MSDDALKIIRGVVAQIESLEKRISELTELTMSISQEIKHLNYLMIGIGQEPKVPSGERNTKECEKCGRNTKRDDMMAKSVPENGDIVIKYVCKSCFYGRRKTFGRLTA